MTKPATSPAFGSDAYWAYFGGRTRWPRSCDIGRHLILPVITLVVVNIAGDSRFVRASMLEALNQDYVRTAKAKGLPARAVTFKHALRNAMLPVRDEHRPRDPVPVHRRDRDRDDLLVARDGQPVHRLRRPAFDYPVLMGMLLDHRRSSWSSRTWSPTSPTPSSIRGSSTECRR